MKLREFDIMPRGYAVAWWQLNTMEAVCFPIGVHLVASAARRAYLAFRAWRVPDVIEQAYQRGVAEGRESSQRTAAVLRDSDQRAADLVRRRAFEEGYRHCLAVLRADITKSPEPAPPKWLSQDEPRRLDVPGGG